VLFSTVVTFANFDIVRVLTQGGSRNMTHLFGTYAFNLGIQSGDIPLRAAVSLFMFPLLAILAFIYFGSIPKELDEAALVDGASHRQMLTKIFIPVALPGIIAAIIFAFTVSWAQFLYPLAFIFSNAEQVLTAGTVTTLIRGDVYHWGGLMAGALMAAAPPVIIFPDGLLHRRPDRRSHQGVGPKGW
jgi:ABC-type glycerol-3-phosphate transport system permease component